MSSSGGKILAQEAYAQGKMIDHSECEGRFPRGITPMDIDELIDNDGCLLACEWSSQHSKWGELKAGQRIAYRNFVKSGHMAALVKHSVPTSQAIHSISDAVSFQVMYLGADGKLAITAVQEGHLWGIFLDEWFRDPYLRLELHKDFYLKTRHPKEQS